MARGIPSYKVIRSDPIVVPQRPTVAKETTKKKQQEATALAPIAPGQVLTTHEIRSRIQHLFDSRNYNPIRELIDLVDARKEDGTHLYDVNFRKELHLELAKYYAPTMKSVEVSGKTDMSITINVVKFDGSEPDVKNVTNGGEGPPIDV